MITPVDFAGSYVPPVVEQKRSTRDQCVQRWVVRIGVEEVPYACRHIRHVLTAPEQVINDLQWCGLASHPKPVQEPTCALLNRLWNVEEAGLACEEVSAEGREHLVRPVASRLVVLGGHPGEFLQLGERSLGA